MKGIYTLFLKRGAIISKKYDEIYLYVSYNSLWV